MKIKIKESGQEVKFGDFIYELYETGGCHFIGKKHMLTKENLKDFVDKGILVVEEDTLTIEKVVEHIANRIGWKPENVEKYLNNLYNISKSALFEILLKELAIMFDKKYKGHISECKEVWVFSRVAGTVGKINTCGVKNFKNFSAFRTYEDISLAMRILSKAVKELYGEQKN